MKKFLAISLPILLLIGGGFFYFYSSNFSLDRSKIKDFETATSNNGLLFSYLMEPKISPPFLIKNPNASNSSNGIENFICANSGKPPRLMNYPRPSGTKNMGDLSYAFCGEYYVVIVSSDSVEPSNFGIFYGGDASRLQCEWNHNDCYFVKAIHENNAKLCYPIYNTEMKRRCLTIIALQTDNPQNCYLLSESRIPGNGVTERQYCISQLISKKAHDKTLTEGFCIANPLRPTQCYKELSHVVEDISYCNKITECYDLVLNKPTDISSCIGETEIDYREDCILDHLLNSKKTPKNLSEISCGFIRDDKTASDDCYILLTNPDAQFCSRKRSACRTLGFSNGFAENTF